MNNKITRPKKILKCKLGLHDYGEWGGIDAFNHIHVRRCKKCKHLHWKKL